MLFEIEIPNLVCGCNVGMGKFPIPFSGYCDLDL